MIASAFLNQESYPLSWFLIAHRMDRSHPCVVAASVRRMALMAKHIDHSPFLHVLEPLGTDGDSAKRKSREINVEGLDTL